MVLVMVYRGALLGLMILWLTGCLSEPGPVSLSRSAEVSYAVVVDTQDSYAVDVAASGLHEALAKMGAQRNIRFNDKSNSLLERFRRHRSSRQRLAKLWQEEGEGGLSVVVELRPKFFSLMNGRYRWRIDATFLVGESARVEDVILKPWSTSVYLDVSQQDYVDAIERISGRLAKALGQELDIYLGNFESRNLEEGAGASGVFQSDDVIYFVMVDRFANGDPSNDSLVDSSPESFHGGDIKGVQDRLPYLKELGVTTLWVSPLFSMRQIPFQGYGAFHGYWVNDLKKAESRFGTMEDVASLVATAHSQDMRVFLDMVLNHVDYDAPLVKERPHWFHKRGGIEDWSDPEELIFGDVHGLPDLAQEKSEVYDYLLEASKLWIDTTALDGFRLDAVKHISQSFWASYNQALRARYGRQFGLLGEVFDGSPAVLQNYMARGKFNSVFDFPLYYSVIDSVCRGGHLGKVASALASETLYGDAMRLVTFVDNHDLPRLRTICSTEPKFERALALWLTSRGVPSITYGTEVGLEGAREPHNRGVMQFAPNSGMTRNIRELLRLRKAHPSMAKGKARFLVVEEEVLVYVKEHGTDRILVGLNNHKAERRALRLPFNLEVLAPKVLLGTDVIVSDSTLDIAPGEVVALELGDVGLDDLTPLRGGPKELALMVEGVELDPGDSLVAAGASPVLGLWEPTQSEVRFEEWNMQARAKVSLNPGQIIEFKLVVRKANGDLRWEERQNRYFLMPWDTKQPVLKLTWRA